MSICAIPEGLLDEQGYLPFTYLSLLNDCELPLNVKGFVAVQTIRDKHGHELDGDWDPKGQGGCDHQETAEWKAEHPFPRKRSPKKELPVPNEPAKTEPTEIVLYASNEATSATPVPAPATTTATVGVDAAVGQMKALLPAGADPALLVGGAAGLAVIGAAIKFGPSVLKARAERAEREHEEKMKRLELEEKKAEKQDDQHQQCSAARVALEARVAAAEAKTADVERKLAEIKSSGSSFDLGDFDPEELEDRLKKLEKALKPAGRAKKKG